MSQTGIANTLHAALGRRADLYVEAFDGSTAGPADAESRLVLRSPLALRHLITGRGSLGLARAFVIGELDLGGNAYTTLKTLTVATTDVTMSSRLALVRAAVQAGGVGVLRP